MKSYAKAKDAPGVGLELKVQRRDSTCHGQNPLSIWEKIRECTASLAIYVPVPISLRNLTVLLQRRSSQEADPDGYDRARGRCSSLQAPFFSFASFQLISHGPQSLQVPRETTRRQMFRNEAPVIYLRLVLTNI